MAAVIIVAVMAALAFVPMWLVVQAILEHGGFDGNKDKPYLRLEE